MYDSQGDCKQVKLDPTMERGLHNIDDEVVITDRDCYVFHDTRGFESGSEVEREIIREFVHRKSRGKRLKNRLHAIWYCIPTDNNRPSLDIKYFENICPDKNGMSKCDLETALTLGTLTFSSPCDSGLHQV